MTIESSFEDQQPVVERKASSGLIANKWLEPLEIVYVLNAQLKASEGTGAAESKTKGKGRIFRKLLVPAHFSLLKLHETIQYSFEMDTSKSGQFYAPGGSATSKDKKGADKEGTISGFDMAGPGFKRKVEESFSKHPIMIYESDGFVFKVSLHRKTFLNLEHPVCKSGKGVAVEDSEAVTIPTSKGRQQQPDPAIESLTKSLDSGINLGTSPAAEKSEHDDQDKDKENYDNGGGKRMKYRFPKKLINEHLASVEERKDFTWRG